MKPLKGSRHPFQPGKQQQQPAWTLGSCQQGLRDVIQAANCILQFPALLLFTLSTMLMQCLATVLCIIAVNPVVEQ